MLKMVFACAIACSASMPAFAGERSVAPPIFRAIPLRAIPPRVIPIHPAPARSIPVRRLPRAAPFQLQVRTATTFVLPAANRAGYDLGAPPAAQHVVAAGYTRHESRPASAFAFPEPRPLPAWQLTGTFPEVTARAGGRYAVGEVLADHRRVGPPRSALDAMLVLRIDGAIDSAQLSVGGGVAGAMWKAGVTR